MSDNNIHSQKKVNCSHKLSNAYTHMGLSMLMKTGSDLVRIQDYIDRGLVKNQKENENSPHSFFPDATLLDKLYGDKPQHFPQFGKTSAFFVIIIHLLF